MIKSWSLFSSAEPGDYESVFPTLTQIIVRGVNNFVDVGVNKKRQETEERLNNSSLVTKSTSPLGALSFIV